MIEQSMQRPTLRRLVIKPTLVCTADCGFCSYRRALHRELRRSMVVPLERWGEIIADARSIGAEYLVISGGEPTLYRNILDLIEMGKTNQLRVTINTNGAMLTEPRIKSYLDAGLDSVCISIHSHLAETHDSMRSQKGLWLRATEGLRFFSKLTANRPGFSLQTQALICRDNYKDLPALVSMHHDFGSQLMRIAYLEGDFDRESLLTEKEIDTFRSDVVPNALVFAKSLDRPLRDAAAKTLARLFSEEVNTAKNFAQGIYRPDYKAGDACPIPSLLALILANGDVHPCNIIEYTHEPVMGNVLDRNLSEIWHGEQWNHFRTEFFDYCRLCPMTLLLANAQMRPRSNA